MTWLKPSSRNDAAAVSRSGGSYFEPKRTSNSPGADVIERPRDPGHLVGGALREGWGATDRVVATR